MVEDVTHPVASADGENIASSPDLVRIEHRLQDGMHCYAPKGRKDFFLAMSDDKNVQSVIEAVMKIWSLQSGSRIFPVTNPKDFFRRLKPRLQVIRNDKK